MAEHRVALLKIKPKSTSDNTTGRRSDANIARATQKSLDDVKKITTPRKQRPKGDRPSK